MANSVSVALHPVFVPMYAFLFFAFLDAVIGRSHSVGQWFGMVSLLLLITILLPVFLLYTLKRIGYIDDYHIDRAEQRSVPYFVSMLFYAVCAWCSSGLGFQFFAPFCSVCVFASFGMYIINKFWKISAHSCGMGILCGTIFVYSWLCAYNFWVLFCVIILLAGLVAWARLKLDAHTSMQVIAGFALGLLNSLLPLLWW